MRKHAEGVGVALESDEVAPLARLYLTLKHFAFAVFEETADGVFAGMAERRVAKVVGKAGRGNYGVDVFHLSFQLGTLFLEFLERHQGDGTSHAGHLETVCQSIVDHAAAWKREDLGLVLQPAESVREYDAVVVALKGVANLATLVRVGNAYR